MKLSLYVLLRGLGKRDLDYRPYGAVSFASGRR